MNQKILFLSLFVVYAFADKPWTGKPLDGKRKHRWQDFHQRLLNQTAEHRADLKVIFFGDSITEFWLKEGKDVWDKYYAPRHAYNYGINGDSVEKLIWHLEHGEFDQPKAKLVVLRIGTKNIYVDDQPQDVAKEIRKALDLILEMQPEAKIILLSILPLHGRLGIQVDKANAIIANYNDDKRVFYLDMSDKFQTSPGHQIKELFNWDKCHLSHKGYQLWYETMEPLFVKLLAE